MRHKTAAIDFNRVVLLPTTATCGSMIEFKAPVGRLSWLPACQHRQATVEWSRGRGQRLFHVHSNMVFACFVRSSNKKTKGYLIFCVYYLFN